MPIRKSRFPFNPWWRVVVMVALVLAAPFLLKFGRTRQIAFDTKRLAELQRARPSIVLLGDSMLESRINEKALSRLAGERCFVLAQGGSSSALWYLMMKNFVAALDPPPRHVFVFFRDRQLTIPSHRTTGEYRTTMEEFMSSREPALDAILSRAEEGSEWQRALERISPDERSRQKARKKLESVALDIVGRSKEYESIRAASRQLFGLGNLRTGMEVDEQGSAERQNLDDADHDFASHVARSFLPAMLNVAKARGIRCVFFEVQKRPNGDGSRRKDTPSSEAYDLALKAYLNREGALFYDEEDDTDITPDLYSSGDHVAASKARHYTELFWRKVAPILNNRSTLPIAE